MLMVETKSRPGNLLDSSRTAVLPSGGLTALLLTWPGLQTSPRPDRMVIYLIFLPFTTPLLPKCQRLYPQMGIDGYLLLVCCKTGLAAVTPVQVASLPCRGLPLKLAMLSAKYYLCLGLVHKNSCLRLLRELNAWSVPTIQESG